MPMRPLALSALALVALVGCGVPDAPVPKSVSDGTPSKTTTDKAKPVEKTPVVKAAEQDPAKLGEKIVDTKVGTGATAEPGDTCIMRYVGRLKSNGKEFDSNTGEGKEPFSFTLGSGQVIKGWDLGVKGMKVGGKRTLEIPPELAYGAEAKDTIPANSTLVFDIELLDVQKVEDANTVVRQTLTPGTGPAVKNGDVVTIKYKAMVSGGKVVDDNGGKPIQFKVGAPEVAVPGLNVALVGMKAGQTVSAKIPPSLGPTRPDPSRQIPPGSSLTFEITLVKIG